MPHARESSQRESDTEFPPELRELHEALWAHTVPSAKGSESPGPKFLLVFPGFLLFELPFISSLNPKSVRDLKQAATRSERVLLGSNPAKKSQNIPKRCGETSGGRREG